MVVVLLSWLSIFIIFFSFGDSLIAIYNKISKREERYGITDTFILGMCFTLIPLSITSLWLPSNQYMMFAYIVLSLIYWIARRKYLIERLQYYFSCLKNVSSTQLSLLFFPFLILILCSLWQSDGSDAPGYHYQLTHWNEAFGVVPGIANLEDRMGFNSNYSLLSAIFTFRFITGDQHFLIQSLLAGLIMAQIIYRSVQNRFDLRYLILLFLFVLLLWNGYFNLSNSSTDILPTLCLFYLFSKYLINPQVVRKEWLLVFFVPVALVTIKLSVAPVLLLNVYCFYILTKEKSWKEIIFLFVLSILVITPWLVRNVIISGYLIFPLYQIDIFTFDWKVPQYVAKKQSDWIHYYPQIAFKNTMSFLQEFIQQGGVASAKTMFVNIIHQIIICLCIILSPIIVCISYFRNKKQNSALYILYLIMGIYIIYCGLFAPDFRFFAGVAYCILFLEICILFKLNTNIVRFSMKINLRTTFVILSFLFLVVAKELYNGYKVVNQDTYHLTRPFRTILYAPYTLKARAKLRIVSYEMGNITVFISTKSPYFPYDYIPGSSAPSDFKYEPIEDVEERGCSLQEGFRPKPIAAE